MNHGDVTDQLENRARQRGVGDCRLESRVADGRGASITSRSAPDRPAVVRESAAELASPAAAADDQRSRHPGPRRDFTSAGTIASPHSEQVGIAWKAWPQDVWTGSSGAPSPAM